MQNGNFPYLEFGSIDTKRSKKEVWGFQLGQKAYDWHMAARYLNDMISYQKMIEDLECLTVQELCSMYSEEIHHANDISVNLGKLCALICTIGSADDKNNHISFAEVGSTVFGCIEGILFCQNLLRIHAVETPSCELKKVQWLGVDISNMFNRLAVLLHQEFSVFTMQDFNDLPPKVDVFFAKGVSLLYAIRNAEQLMKLIDRSRFSLFDYSFSMMGEQNLSIGTGKKVCYLDYNNFRVLLEKSEKNAYVRKNKSYYTEKTNRVFLDLIFAEDSLAKDFISEDIRIRNSLREKLKNEEYCVQLIDVTRNEKVEWVPLQEFVDTIVL